MAPGVGHELRPRVDSHVVAVREEVGEPPGPAADLEGAVLRAQRPPDEAAHRVEVVLGQAESE
jgi:hypothetical protein